MTSSNESASQSPKTKPKPKPKLTRLQGVKGMNDILPPDSQDWEWFEGRVRHWMGCYGYRPIRTPIVEPTALYVRGLGEVTDIVEKEMYSFEDRLNGENLTLRPEGTAGVVRSVIEHNLLYEGGKRLYYIGPMFRHERPQRGRYRQFHQVGVEALGFAGPEVDAEVILLAHALWQDLGLADVCLELNCLGELPERQAHRAALIAHLEQHKDVLDADAQRRLYSNPLRILDTKNPAMQEMVNQAPQLLDFLSPASRSHFDAVCKILEASGVAYRINPRLVRGMDYYNLTVFEFVTQSLGAQGTLCGGGRYNDLIACMGGQPAPAVGWGMGMERVLDLLKTRGRIPPAADWDVYAIVPDEATLPLAVSVCQQLRQSGVRVQLHSRAELGSGMGSMKSQFKRADASGARHALIFGPDEVAQGQVTVKALRDGQGAQRLEPMAQVALWACSLQSPPSAHR